MAGNRHIKAAMRVAACLCIVALIVVAPGCRPTDFFTEVVITTAAQEVDENNPNQTVVNTPDAQRESREQSALDLSADAQPVDRVENIVVYSSEPNMSYTTHRSIFSLDPLLNGVESSDPVALAFSKDAVLDFSSYSSNADFMEAISQVSGSTDMVSEDAEANPNGNGMVVTSSPETNDESDSQGSDGESTNDESNAGGSGKGTGDTGDSGDANGSGTSGSGAGEEGENGDGGTGSGDGDSGTDGEPDGGAGGTINVYNPGDARSEVQKANSVAAIGQAAVIVQAIGGKGALCAIDSATYGGMNAKDADASYAAAFKDVFADELPDEGLYVAWSGNGSSPSYVHDISALADKVGQKGVIMYDQSLGNYTDLFSEEQLNVLIARDIQLVPIDLSTVGGILDSVKVVGECLSESSALEEGWSSKDMATLYTETLTNIVNKVIGLNGGKYATSDGKSDYTKWGNWSFSCQSVQGSLYTAFATEFETETTLSSSSQYDVTTSNALLFTHTGYLSTPLSFWAQCAGVIDRTAEQTGETDKAKAAANTKLSLLWQYTEEQSVMGVASGPLNEFNPSAFNGGAGTHIWGTARVVSLGGQSEQTKDAGIGTSGMPYLIVCGTDEHSSAEVEDAVVRSMSSYQKHGTISAYSALSPYGSSTAWYLPCAADDGNGHLIFGSVGARTGTSEDADSWSAFYKANAVLYEDVVRQNPTGLLGDWTDGTMESVLECLWLATIYSQTPDNSDYKPSISADAVSNLNVEVGGKTCNTLHEALDAFYSTFYRCDSYDYAAVVPDESL